MNFRPKIRNFVFGIYIRLSCLTDEYLFRYSFEKYYKAGYFIIKPVTTREFIAASHKS